MNLRRWAGVVLGAMVGTSAVTGAVPTAATAAPPLVTIAEPTVWLSPNGDGRQDSASVRFRLAKESAVTVVVGGSGRKEAVSLGTLAAGAHRWSWNGRIGGLVPDGRYRVVIRAQRDGRVDAVKVRAVVDTVPDQGRLVASRPTVHPKATAVVDHALVTYLRGSWSPQNAVDGTFGLALGVEFTVLAPDGSVVTHRSMRTEGPATLDWSGRGAGGEPLTEGRYTVRVRVIDPAGNRSRYTQPLDVSHRQLRKDLVTTTVPAAAASTWDPAYPGSCLGCGEWCSPVPSARYVAGLSFDVASCGWGSSLGFFAWTPPFRAAPVDTYRVTAVGGPAIPGTQATLALSGEVMGPGDDTATTPWTGLDLGRPPYLPDGETPATWSASAGVDAAYDVASFTIEYVHWVPVEG